MSKTISAGIGWSANANPAHAGTEAASAALARLSLSQPKLVMVFGSSWFDQPALIAGVRAIFADVPLVGESTAGEITPNGPASHSCVVVAIASDALQCSVGMSEHVDQTPREAGQQAAYAALRNFQGSPRIGFLFFGDGLVTHYADVVWGIEEVVGTSSLIVGAMAGDDLRFLKTYQYVNDRVVSRSVVGALIGGAGKIGIGSAHGFAPISKPHHVTRSRANVVFELDHRPAASIYEAYVGSDLVHQMQSGGLSRQGIAYPLGIQCENSGQWLLRNVVSFQPDGSLSCSGEMPEHALVQLMIGSRELALEGARKAAQEAIRSLNRVACVLVFDSILRRKLLGEHHAAAEIASIRQIVGPAVPLAGCYTYGEQAPVGITSLSGRTAVQTGSVLIVALGT